MRAQTLAAEAPVFAACTGWALSEEGGERIECERGWMKGCGDDKVTFDKLISLLKAMNQMNRHPSGHLC